MLPALNVPAATYRLMQTGFFLPLVLAAWILMAGSARLLSIAFGGGADFDSYLRLFAFSFFPFWILATAIDAVVSGPLGGFVLSALRLEYGPAVRTVVVAFYPVMYTVVYGLGGLYSGIAAYHSGDLSVPRSAVIGLAAFAWPMALSALLLR